MIRSSTGIAVCIAGAAMCSLAFAAAGEGQAQQVSPNPQIGEEVDRICFVSNINGWRSVKGEDDVVLLQRSVNDWYRVELTGGCRESILRSAIDIGIDTRPGGGCITRGDVIIVKDTPGFARRCMISHMYKWDEKAADTDGATQDSDAGSEQ